jgi:hypothetical protein
MPEPAFTISSTYLYHALRTQVSLRRVEGELWFFPFKEEKEGGSTTADEQEQEEK